MPPRTSGKAETTEAASPTAWRFQRLSSNLRSDRALWRRRRRVAVVGRVPGIEQRLRHRAIEQAGVEVPQAVMGREPLAERPLPDAAGPSMAMIMSDRRRGRASCRRTANRNPAFFLVQFLLGSRQPDRRPLERAAGTLVSRRVGSRSWRTAQRERGARLKPRPASSPGLDASQSTRKRRPLIDDQAVLVCSVPSSPK